MLRVLELRKRFGATAALDGFTLDVAAGEIVGLVGHNGAGKSTFTRAVAGLIRLDGGQVHIGGRPVSHRSRPGARVGVAAQELALFPTSAIANLRYFASLYGLPRRVAARRIEQIAADLGLDGLLGKPVWELSGGQQRRLHTAVAMVHRPPVLLLDEPTVGADPVTRELLLGTVRRAADDGAAVVYTTHYLPELEVLDATLAVAGGGRVIARGERAGLLAALPGRVELTFGHPVAVTVPPAVDPASTEISGSGVAITARDPAVQAGRLLAANPAQAAHLRSIDLFAPTLDDLYRSLVVTGHDGA